MAKSKSKSKSQSKRRSQEAAKSPRTKFTLTPDHKRFLTRRAEEHAQAATTEKPGIVAKAIDELLKEYSITERDDVQEAKKVSDPKAIRYVTF